MTEQYTADFLLGLLERVEIPASHSESADVTIDCRDGWKVVIFYDCGDLDYIDSFISPDGERIEWWWDAETLFSGDGSRLRNWRG